MQNPVHGLPAHWLSYVLVDDVVAATERARSLGAAITHEVTEIPGMGAFSVIFDPTGAALGLFQDKTPPA